MWHPFKKRAQKAAEQETPANDDTAIVEDVTPEPTPEEKAADISELLSRLSQEKDPGPAERKLLSAAFSKAAGAMLAEAELVTDKTVTALAEYAEAVDDAELHAEAVSRMASVGKKYPKFADTAVAVLIPSLVDAQQDVRHAAVYGLKEIAEANPDYTAIVFGTFIEKTECAYQDVRTDVVAGLTSIALKNAEYADDAVKKLSEILAKAPDAKDVARQEYTLRIQAARRLGEITLAHETQLEAALTGLKAGLSDDDLFVRYRTMESLLAIGDKYESAKDGIVDMLKAAKEGAQYIVKEKLDGIINHLKPPVKPEKTPAEIEAERKAEAAREKAIEAARKKSEEAQRQKAEADAQKKSRIEGIKTLANKLPGKTIK